MKSVRALDGTNWRVGLHWARRPRWRKVRLFRRANRPTTRQSRERLRWWDFIDFPIDFGDDLLAGIVVVLVIAGVVVFMIFLGWPLLLLIIDTLWGIAALVLGGLARVLFRRPWILVAETEGDKRVWQVRNWRAARRAERIVCSAVRAGRPLPRAFPAAPIT